MVHLMPRIRSQATVAASYEEVRPLYERADGLDSLTPSVVTLFFEPIAGELDHIERGTRFNVEVSVPIIGTIGRGDVEIVEHTFDDSGGYIEDVVTNGPVDVWHHRRTLQPYNTGTMIIDDLQYRGLPGGLVGELLAPIVLRIGFEYRRRQLYRLFGRMRDDPGN